MAKVLVVGAGTMGVGIVLATAQQGHSVTMLDIYVEQLNKGRQAIKQHLMRLMSKGKISEAEQDTINGSIEAVSEWPKHSFDVMIEAVSKT